MTATDRDDGDEDQDEHHHHRRGLRDITNVVEHLRCINDCQQLTNNPTCPKWHRIHGTTPTTQIQRQWRVSTDLANSSWTEGLENLVSLVRILQKMHDFVLSMELLPLLCLMHGISWLSMHWCRKEGGSSTYFGHSCLWNCTSLSLTCVPMPAAPVEPLTLKLLGSGYGLLLMPLQNFNTKLWVFFVILVCASHALPLPQILFKNRFKNDNGSNCLLSIDGADFKIPNHGWKYYCHKLKGSGLRYEVGLSIQKGDICWIFGPFKCGQFTDLMIFRMGLKKELGRGEKVIADGIYGAEAPLKVRATGTFFSKPQNQAMEKRVRAWHEHCNRRMK